MGPEQRSPVPDLPQHGPEQRSPTLADHEGLEAAMAEWFESVRRSPLSGREQRSPTLADQERLDRFEAAMAEWFESVQGSPRQLEAQEGYLATQAVIPALQRLAAANGWSE